METFEDYFNHITQDQIGFTENQMKIVKVWCLGSYAKGMSRGTQEGIEWERKRQEERPETYCK